MQITNEKFYKVIYRKYKNMSIVAKSAVWFVICSLLRKSISLVTVPIFTRIMTTDQFGLYSTYLSWNGILIVLLTLNFESCAYANIIGKSDSEDEKNNAAVSLLTLAFTIITLALITSIIFRNQISTLINMPIEMIVVMIIEIYSVPVINFWSYLQRFQYHYILLVIVTVVQTLFSSILGIVLVMNCDMKDQALMRVLSIAFVGIIIAVIIYISFAKKAKKIFYIDNWKKALKLQLPLVPHNLSMSLLGTADRIMINAMVSVAAAGIYSIAYSTGQIMSMLKSCIVDAARPWIYEKLRKNQYYQIKQTINVTLILVAGIAILFSAVAPEIIKVMAPSEYYEAVYVIPPVAISSYFIFLYQLFVIVETYYEKTTQIMTASVLAAVINVILNFLFIPIYGLIAAGYTTLVSYLILSILHFRTLKRIQKDSFDGNNIYDVKIIVIISIVVIISSILVSIMYKNAILRYFCVAFICSVLYINKQKIIVQIKEIRSKK